jgi:hypothetical protein
MAKWLPLLNNSGSWRTATNEFNLLKTRDLSRLLAQQQQTYSISAI